MQVARMIGLDSGKPLRDVQWAEPRGLWERISLLQEDDRILLELSLRAGASCRQIGRALRRSPGSVSRSLRRLGRRLHDPLVLTLLHPECPLEPVYRQIGVEHFLTGRTVPQLARRHALPPMRVRQIVQIVRSWHRSFTARRNGSGGGGGGGH
jgi:hypothetical protein